MTRIRRQCSHLLTPSDRFSVSSMIGRELLVTGLAHAVDECGRTDALLHASAGPRRAPGHSGSISAAIVSRPAVRSASSASTLAAPRPRRRTTSSRRRAAPSDRPPLCGRASPSSCSRSSMRARSSSSRPDRRLRTLAISCWSASSSLVLAIDPSYSGSAPPAPSGSSSRSRARNGPGLARSRRACSRSSPKPCAPQRRPRPRRRELGIPARDPRRRCESIDRRVDLLELRADGAIVMAGDSLADDGVAASVEHRPRHAADPTAAGRSRPA